MNAVVSTELALAAPRIGEYWIGQGGIYAGIMPGEEGGRDYHLITSVDDAEDLAWGPYGESIEEARSRYDGPTNTAALVAASTDHPAAQWAAAYTADGHTDFYLPAQRELNLCYATIPAKFAADWYWSSTEESSGWAWFQYFGSGLQLSHRKDSKLRARAVRRLFI